MNRFLATMEVFLKWIGSPRTLAETACVSIRLAGDADESKAFEKLPLARTEQGLRNGEMEPSLRNMCDTTDGLRLESVVCGHCRPFICHV